MVMTPNKLEDYIEPTLATYREIESKLLDSIADKLKTDGTIDQSSVAQWRVDRLNEMGRLSQENINYISSKSGVIERDVRRSFERVALESLVDDEKAYKKAVESGIFLNQPVPIGQSAELKRIIDIQMKLANDTLNLVNSTAVEFTNRRYAQIINRVYSEVVSGSYSYNTAIGHAVREAVDLGITAQRYVTSSGKVINYPLESAIRREILTMSKNVGRESQIQRAKDYGSDLFLVSEHAGARELCYPYQNRVISRTNSRGTTEDFYGNKIRYIPLSSTSFGMAAGLFGINCEHFMQAFIPSITIIRESKLGSKEEDELINRQAQRQRDLEVAIRKTKKKMNMFNDAGNENEFFKSKNTLLNQEERLKEFMNDTGRTQTPRVQVYGFRRTMKN